MIFFIVFPPVKAKKTPNNRRLFAVNYFRKT
jgi:hypothetical protein